ncbi:uncharacterized protein HD556DRAFT_1451217 [Suillus plorans]|uniref:Uncharacterized protein n=1 Tax=Suillus plorans TaxID=116603 RepID=A0A9P7AA90_9AGAM|nr:uncharacterized protein HD556DRAFT_1451217 [Suillus plorans]KAG1784978.1 hypothetical protein HD556DRAFT_1451217 [Suillus plorans]
MSMSQMAVLTRAQRDMLKTFLPAFKIVCSGSVEEQEEFWESVYSQWFATWPERAVQFVEIPHDQALSGLQQELLVEATRGYVLTVGEAHPDFYTHEHVVPGDTCDDEGVLSCEEVEKVAELDEVVFCMAGKKWATPEQEEFLLSFMSEYRETAATKDYDDFFTRIWALWFERWPEEHIIFKDMPDDYVRTPDGIKALATAVATRQQQLVTWYRWQMNPARHARSKGARGVLKFDTILGGGVELKGTRAPQKIDIYSHEFYGVKVKHTADDAIAAENITNRGPKLNKRREITRRMYLEESESVKADIDRKYRKAKAKFAKKRQQLKSGKALKIDDATKVKAIQQLGPMLDRILKYLAHITGGWKFTVLMGGRDPGTGETSVFNYHVGKLQSGTQFNHVYKDFDGMQAAFLAFVQNTLAFESTLPHDESAMDEDDESSSNWDSDEDCNNEREKSVEEGTSRVIKDVPSFDTSGLYQMTPQPEEILGDNISDSHTAWGTSAAFDPIIAGTINFSAFDPHAFTNIVDNPNFDPGALDNARGTISDLSLANLTSPDNRDSPYLPPNPQVEVLLPAVQSANSEEEQDNDPLLDQPEVRSHCGQHMCLVSAHATMCPSTHESVIMTLEFQHVVLVPQTHGSTSILSQGKG